MIEGVTLDGDGNLIECKWVQFVAGGGKKQCETEQKKKKRSEGSTADARCISHHYNEQARTTGSAFESTSNHKTIIVWAVTQLHQIADNYENKIQYYAPLLQFQLPICIRIVTDVN